MEHANSSRRRRRDESSSNSDSGESSDPGEVSSGSGPPPAKKGKGKAIAVKRRAVGTKSVNFQANKNMMVEGLKKASGRLQGQIAKIPHHLVQVDKDGRRAISTLRPPKTMEELIGMLPTISIDAIWTREEEDSFKASLATDPYHRYIESDAALPRKGNHSYWTMWKVIPRLRNCFPTDIIGVKAHLKYGTDVDIGGGIGKPSLQWSSNFCEHLTQLALGSPCQGNMRLLSLLIRYAVADRTDDRRQVPLDEHRINSKFLDEFAVGIRQSNDSTALRELHVNVRARWETAGFSLPWESDVMCSIESQNNPVRSQKPTMPTPGEGEVFKEVIRACDATGDLGYASFNTVEQRATLLAHGRTRQDPLQHENKDELRSLRTPLLEDDERFKARRLLEMARQRDSGGSEAEDHVFNSDPDPEPEPDSNPDPNLDSNLPDPDRDHDREHDHDPDSDSDPDHNYDFDADNGSDFGQGDSQGPLLSDGGGPQGPSQDGLARPIIISSSTDDDDDPSPMAPPVEGALPDTLEEVVEDQELKVYNYWEKKRDNLGDWDSESTIQPYNLPEVALALKKDPSDAVRVGTGDFRAGIAKNSANVLSELGYAGHFHL
ncbi:hypothetical protein GGS24DRAFT_513815 [Hypoxylon argillaceum]|nr:hypothetical protein GGS24DRAFT_513815 [Hypoxylon argillaceum]